MNQVINRVRGVALYLKHRDNALFDVAVVVEADLALQRLQFGGGDRVSGQQKYTGRTVGVLAEKRGKERIFVHYVLMKSIRPRLGFRRSVLNSMNMISAAVERGAKRGG